MNAEDLKKLRDEELAKLEWPTLGKITGPDAILIREEWERRRRLDLKKSNRELVLMGGLLGVLGTLAGVLLTKLL